MKTKMKEKIKFTMCISVDEKTRKLVQRLAMKLSDGNMSKLVNEAIHEYAKGKAK